MSKESELNDLNLSLGRHLTQTIVPEELPFFDDLVLQDKTEVRRRDHSLGFGVSPESSGAIASILFSVGTTVLGFVWQYGKDAAGALIKDLSDDLRSALARRLKAWIENKAAAAPPVKLGAEKLQLLLGSVRARAQELQLSSEETEKLCSAVSELFPA